MNHEDFKDAARKHQINFKITNQEINIGADKYPIRVISRKDTGNEYSIEVKSSLKWEDCRDEDNNYRIFFSGFRKKITEEVDRIYSSTKGQMVTNLLRSEHIPYNVFFPMNNDLKGAKFIFNNILGKERIAEIKRILIEYNPKGLCDGTSFDTYVEYIPVGAKAGEKGGIGIEVKYTEKEYQIKRGSKEWLETHNESGVHLADNYRIPSCQCGWFKTEYINDVSFDNQKQMASHVTANLYRQIWRNHILGASMMLGMCPDKEDKLAEFTSLTVYPKDNSHFSNVFKNYESMLTESGRTTFKHITYEELFPMIKECISESFVPNLNEWVDYLQARYIINS